MSSLVFDGAAHTLTLFDAQNSQVGQWYANNIVDHRATFRFVPNRTYHFLDHAHPRRHHDERDTLNGGYGRFGIYRLQPFRANGHTHAGVGVHSGRLNRGGPDHPTMGCIRTMDAALGTLVELTPGDPLQTLTVQNNHKQPNVHPYFRPDDHDPKPALPANAV